VKSFSPLQHQSLAIDWLKEREEAALFAGMGLGKTASVLSAFDYLSTTGAIKGLLVIAPLRVATLTWPNEIEKWQEFSWMKVANLRTKEGQNAFENGTADIYLLNYEQIPNFCKRHLKGKRVHQVPVNAVVWDELSRAKNHSAKRINLFRHYRRFFKFHWGLTGTPHPNGLLDIFAQIRLLDDGKRLGKAFTLFRDTYFKVSNPYSDFPKFEPLKHSNDVILKKVSGLALTLRTEDWLDIPPTRFEDIEVSLPKDAAKTYKELQKEFLAEIEGKEITAVNAGVQVMKLLQVTSGAVYDDEKRVVPIHQKKIEALRKLKKQLGEPLLVATHFRHEQDRIKAAFPEAEKFGQDTLPRWRSGKIPILVADPRSIGHGVDGLQDGGRVAVWFTPPYSRELWDQFNARLARTGQQHETLIYRLLCPGTIDDAAAEALREKGLGQSAFLLAIRNLQKLVKTN
jgi:SNF2 family DNA or RNA helicase